MEGGEDASVPRDEEEGSVEEEEVKPVFCPLSLSSVVVRYLIRQKIDYILFTFLQKALHYNTSSADFTPWISAVSIFYHLLPLLLLKPPFGKVMVPKSQRAT